VAQPLQPSKLVTALGNVPVPYSPDLPPDVSVEHTHEGIWTWTNAQNGFRVALVHFTSDPAKRSTEFREEARKGISVADYEREYNIRWQSFKGKAVYGEDFKRGFHVASSPLRAASHLPIVRGWDFGLYPACIFTQLWPGMRLMVLREICEKGMGLERFLQEVQAKTLEWFPNHKKFYEIVDPAGFARSPNDERTAVSLMTAQQYNLKVIPGVQVPATRLNSVRKFLERNVKGEPALQLDPSCKMLIHGFDGGYHYEYNNSDQLRDKPEKNEYSHPHDALQYICTRVLEINLTDSPPPPIAQPAYGFSRGNALKESDGHSISRSART
jgi:hypothetical protein